MPAQLKIKTQDGTWLVVPASLNSLTTYVLLEQERWFEKEVAFVDRLLRPGMTAIDIGANLGVYSLMMARRVGSGGRVFAYEPSSETRKLLDDSRALNGIANHHIVGAALSDRIGSGRLVFGPSSEFNALGHAGIGETVDITTLDSEDAKRSWSPPDFVKIDAEGEEARIIAGGRRFFERHSPLVMFEIKAGDAVSHGLRREFEAIGYRVFRLLGGLPVLVPDDANQRPDDYELNMFAAKPDRARSLAADDLLVESVPSWAPNESDRRAALELVRAQSFAPAFGDAFQASVRDPDYLDALAGYATWRRADRPLPERWAALAFACSAANKACMRDPSVARRSTLARFAWEAGHRSVAVRVLGDLIHQVIRAMAPPSEPFWPAAPRFDHVAPGNSAALWFTIGAVEQFEQVSNHSTTCAPSPWPARICNQSFASIEMERRRVLQIARAGTAVDVPAKLLAPAPGHVNSQAWREGAIPNTRVRS